MMGIQSKFRPRSLIRVSRKACLPRALNAYQLSTTHRQEKSTEVRSGRRIGTNFLGAFPLGRTP